MLEACVSSAKSFRAQSLDALAGHLAILLMAGDDVVQPSLSIMSSATFSANTIETAGVQGVWPPFSRYFLALPKSQ